MGGKRITHDEFVGILREQKSPIIPLEKYHDKHTKILCQCTICEYEWNAEPAVLIRGHGCPRCARKQISVNKTLTHEDFLKQMEKVNSDIEFLSVYTGARNPIKCKCKKCGCEWETKAGSLQHGHGCRVCGYEKVSQLLTKTNEEFLSQLKKKNPYIYPLEEYKHGRQVMKFKCLQCSYIFTSSPHEVLAGHGCPSCKCSQGEKLIKQFLDDYNIEYIYQYKTQDCKNINTLSFDFYLPEIKTVIEYDGQQHFKPVSFGSKNEEKVLKNFKEGQKRDKIKNKYCEDNGIKMIRIPYTKFDNIEQILRENNIIL